MKKFYHGMPMIFDCNNTSENHILNKCVYIVEIQCLLVNVNYRKVA